MPKLVQALRIKCFQLFRTERKTYYYQVENSHILIAQGICYLHISLSYLCLKSSSNLHTFIEKLCFSWLTAFHFLSKIRAIYSKSFRGVARQAGAGMCKPPEGRVGLTYLFLKIERKYLVFLGEYLDYRHLWIIRVSK